ncbi:DUF1413 domain-containing protein [Bacillus sp. FSL K6-3431]|uniref:DUF1413 domain-containing protein n=1 Tax=Bacillus sp. FSL K6-3431 TaxID=2921500 RepID=UPI0030FA049D
MTEKLVKLTMSEAEYEAAMDEANGNGFANITDYLRNFLFEEAPDFNYDELLAKFKKAVYNLKSGEKFRIRDLFDSNEWDEIPVQVRRDFGRMINRRVSKNSWSSIKSIGKDSANALWYEFSCHYEKGLEDKIAFVFLGPGQEEQKQGKPAVGQVGENLSSLLKKLRSSSTSEDWKREKITVTSAWNNVEYKMATGRAEASFREVLSEENLNRLVEELKDVQEYIICCSDKAYKAVIEVADRLNQNVKVIQIQHLDIRSINQIKKDVDGKEIAKGAKNATSKRLEVIAKNILK